jgi:O-antigen ligase
MHRSTALATLLIVTAALTAVQSLPDMVGYLTAVAAAGVVGLAIFRDNDWSLPVRAHPAILAPLVILWIVFAVELVLYPSAAALKRAPVYIAFSAFFVFVVPAVIPHAAIERAVAGVTAVAVLLAIPGALFGRFWIGTLPDPLFMFPTGRLFIDVPGIDGIFVMKSVFHTPNHLAYLALFGLLGAAHRIVAARRGDSRTWVWVLCGALSILGLSLTWGRAVLLALACCFVLAVVYHLVGFRALIASVGGLCVAAAAGVVLVLVAPDFWRAIGPSLTGRAAIWNAAFARIVERPLAGWGFVNPRRVGVPHTSIHNSYLRLFFIGGIIGGLAYLALTLGAVWTALSRVRAGTDLWVLLWVVAVLVSQVFQGTSIFGLSLVSVLFALAVGYVQPASAEWTLELSTATLPSWSRHSTDD